MRYLPVILIAGLVTSVATLARATGAEEAIAQVAQPSRSATKQAVVKRARGNLQRAGVQHARATLLPQRLNIEVQEPRLFGGSGRVAGDVPGTNVYSNEIEPIVTFYPLGANQQMADDLELAAGACEIV